MSTYYQATENDPLDVLVYVVNDILESIDTQIKPIQRRSTIAEQNTNTKVEPQTVSEHFDLVSQVFDNFDALIKADQQGTKIVFELIFQLFQTVFDRKCDDIDLFVDKISDLLTNFDETNNGEVLLDKESAEIGEKQNISKSNFQQLKQDLLMNFIFIKTQNLTEKNRLSIIIKMFELIDKQISSKIENENIDLKNVCGSSLFFIDDHVANRFLGNEHEKELNPWEFENLRLWVESESVAEQCSVEQRMKFFELAAKIFDLKKDYRYKARECRTKYLKLAEQNLNNANIKKECVEVLVSLVKSLIRDLFQPDDIFQTALLTKLLQKFTENVDDADKNIVSLKNLFVDVFLNGKLEDYWRQFYFSGETVENSEFDWDKISYEQVDKQVLNEEDNCNSIAIKILNQIGIKHSSMIEKMRLLTICSLAFEKEQNETSSNSVLIHYSTLKKELKIDSNIEIENLIFLAIKKQLIEARINQQNESIVFIKYLKRDFGKQQKPDQHKLREKIKVQKEGLLETFVSLQSINRGGSAAGSGRNSKFTSTATKEILSSKNIIN